jgi:hypothetical protein
VVLAAGLITTRRLEIGNKVIEGDAVMRNAGTDLTRLDELFADRPLQSGDIVIRAATITLVNRT